MLFAAGWAVARSSRTPLEGEPLDDRTKRADDELYARLRAHLSEYEEPDLLWTFRESLNHTRGILLMSSSRNHRGDPTVLKVLHWLAVEAPGSHGCVHLHDDEDDGRGAVGSRRGGVDYSNVFRVWRLLDGRVEEMDDPFLSPIAPGG